MTLKHKVGDRVRLIKADGNPFLIGCETTIAFVGPWKKGDMHPNGLMCLADNDYLVNVPTPKDDSGWMWFSRFDGDNYLAARESNLEAV